MTTHATSLSVNRILRLSLFISVFISLCIFNDARKTRGNLTPLGVSRRNGFAQKKYLSGPPPPVAQRVQEQIQQVVTQMASKEQKMVSKKEKKIDEPKTEVFKGSSDNISDEPVKKTKMSLLEIARLRSKRQIPQ